MFLGINELLKHILSAVMRVDHSGLFTMERSSIRGVLESYKMYGGNFIMYISLCYGIIANLVKKTAFSSALNPTCSTICFTFFEAIAILRNIY